MWQERWVFLTCILSAVLFLWNPLARAAELTDQELSELRKVIQEREKAEIPKVQLTPEEMAKPGALSDEELSGVRSFLNTFKGIKFSGFVESFYGYNTANPHGTTRAVGGRRGAVYATDDATKVPRSSGTFDRNITSPAIAGLPQPQFLEVRAFNREDNSFTLNNIELHIYKEATTDDPIGFRITTLYGEQAQRLTFVPSEGRVDDDDFTVGEGYVWWKAPLGKGLDVKFGKFATWIGAEVWESPWNPNFSRGLLYTNAIPFTHTGLSLGYPILDGLYGSVFLVNGWDTFVDNNRGKTVGYQLRKDIPDMPFLHKAFFVINGSHGPEQPDNSDNWRHFWDLIFQFSPTDWLTLNTNFDYGTEKFPKNAGRGFGGGFGVLVPTGDTRSVRRWWGIAQMIVIQPTPRVGLALRGEYFWDRQAARIVPIAPVMRSGTARSSGQSGLSYAEFTATVNIKIRDKLMIRPEVRMDKVVGTDGTTSSHQFENDTSNTTGTLALTYEF